MIRRLNSPDPMDTHFKDEETGAELRISYHHPSVPPEYEIFHKGWNYSFDVHSRDAYVITDFRAFPPAGPEFRRTREDLQVAFDFAVPMLKKFITFQHKQFYFGHEPRIFSQLPSTLFLSELDECLYWMPEIHSVLSEAIALDRDIDMATAIDTTPDFASVSNFYKLLGTGPNSPRVRKAQIELTELQLHTKVYSLYHMLPDAAPRRWIIDELITQYLVLEDLPLPDIETFTSHAYEVLSPYFN